MLPPARLVLPAERLLTAPAGAEAKAPSTWQDRDVIGTDRGATAAVATLRAGPAGVAGSAGGGC